MADIKFSEFPKATTSKDSDEIAILQDGVNKMIPSPVLESKIINKTVSRVIEQGGLSLNLVNLKGVVPTYADLATITPAPEVNDAYQVEADGLVYVYTDNGFQAQGDGFVVQAEPTGVVEVGNTNAVSGGEVYNFAKDVEVIKTGAIKNWELKPYVAGSVVKHNGNIWIANINVSTAEPSVSVTGWSVYNPYSKSTALLISLASTLTINLVTNEAIFTGASTNKIITDTGIKGVTAQTVSLVNPTYFCFVYNSTTGIVRTESVTNNNAKSIKSDEYIFGYVLNLTEPNATVYGITNYTLIKSTGTTVYPTQIPEINVDVLYNRNFDFYHTSRTKEEKEWLNKAIIDVQFFNLKNNQSAHLYGIGKKYSSSNLCYLGFAVTETGLATKFIYADEFNNNLNMPYDANIHTGVKTYFLRNGTETTRNSTILGKITIDWDSIPDGKRVLEGNSNVETRNTRFLREKYLSSNDYNNQFGKIKFSKSKSFYDYYNAPIIESYSSAEGVNSMIPKTPYERVENWFLKWDELITNKPLGYSITKETLTTQVPTDTTESGFLPIYSYSFRPDKLKAGDSTANNLQTLPKILIDCSIHGFEKIPSFIVYEFLKEMLFNWKTHKFLEYLRFNVEFVIIPSANPHGWNAGNGAGTRVNFNQVDLNRNNKIGWTLNGSPGDSTYSGSAPLSEIETQKLYEWTLNNNTGNAILGIDFHNFHGTPQADPKNYNMVWVINASSELGQSCSNVLLKELSVIYKEKSNLIPQSDDYFVGNSNNYSGSGQVGTQYKQLGVTYGCTFEVAQNFRFDAGFKGFDTNAMTFGLESFVNFLRVYIDAFIEEYNRLQK